MRKKEYNKMAKVQKTNWWFQARRNLIGLLLDRYLNKKQPKILEVGCGTGANLKMLSKIGSIVGLDNSKTAIAFCRKQGIPARLGLATSLPFRAQFDAVLLLDVLEHLKAPEQAVAEALRVLRKGGIIIVTVPAHPSLYSYHDKAIGHKKRYSKKELLHLFGSKTVLLSYFFSYSLLPSILIRFFKQKLSATEADDFSMPEPLNTLLVLFSKLEVFSLRLGLPIPFGTSLVCVARK